MIKHVLLDLDGVLVNFIGGVLNKLGLSLTIEELYENNFGELNFFKLIPGITERDFYGMCDSKFWSSLEWMPDGKELLDGICNIIGRENVSFWSSPANHDGCLEGKRKWCSTHLSFRSSAFIFGSAKHRGARSDTVLIDDANHNIYDFHQAGGQAILVPRIWNSLHHQRHHTVEYVLSKLKQFLET